MARIEIRVHPRARRSAFVGWHDDIPKFAVTAPPVAGAANAAVVAAIAGALGRRARDVRIVHGDSSRRKPIEIDGFDDASLAAAIEALEPR